MGLSPSESLRCRLNAAWHSLEVEKRRRRDSFAPLVLKVHTANEKEQLHVLTTGATYHLCSSKKNGF